MTAEQTVEALTGARRLTEIAAQASENAIKPAAAYQVN